MRHGGGSLAHTCVNHREIEQGTSRFTQGKVVTQVRLLRWHDLPLAYRLIGHGTSFDSQFSLTTGDDGLRYGLLANTGNTQAFVLRKDGGAFAVLRCLPGTLYAGLSYLAPALDEGGCERQWLELIGGMSVIAGQRGIVAIRAEVGDDTPEFAALRESEFGVYAHQTIWDRPPAPVECVETALRPISSSEAAGLVDAWNARAPSLLRQANVPLGADAECYVLENRHSASGMAAVYRGGQRILVDLYMSLEAHEAARAMIEGLMSVVGAGSTTVTCRLRHDMEWLGRHLTDEGFEWLGSQAVMVRHTMAHVRGHALKELPVRKGMALTTSHIRELEPTGPGTQDTTAQPV
jgi:hypothetical protein